ncbi:MAG: choice-of-anchor L domain-containing protein [Xenococcaceae cyanobacterium]
MKKLLVAVGFATFGVLNSGQATQALTFDLIEGTDDPNTLLPAALLGPNNGIDIVDGTVNFVGRVGDGTDPNTAQSATYTNFNLSSSGSGPNISNPDGIFLTSGVANLPSTNTDASFDHGSVGVAAPGTGSDADLTAIAGTGTNDVNSLEFDFTVNDPSFNAITANFVFGSDEFPDQSVTDAFAFIVDGQNYAVFPDGSLVSFVTGANASNFNDNASSNYPLEYDGISNSLQVKGLLDPNLTTHSLKIVVGDTNDSIFDSGVFIGNLSASVATSEGGVGGPSSVPFEFSPTLGLFAVGGLWGASRLRKKMTKATINGSTEPAM